MARPRCEPFEVVGLVLINIAVFMHQRSLDAIHHARFDFRYGAVPVLMSGAWQAFVLGGSCLTALPRLLPTITANFLHVSVGHLGGNMLFLWIFGSALSQREGRLFFVVSYTLSGAIAVLVYVHANQRSEVPMLGASGAIAGLEGAYVVFLLRWRLRLVTVWPLRSTIPAWGLGLLATANFAVDTESFLRHRSQEVALGAHLGGLLGGALLAFMVSTVRRE